MADKEEGVETAPRGADWEVVSLTASTYAAAPGPNVVEEKDDGKSESVIVDKGETSHPLFMSGHFVFPPSQHANLPLEPERTEIFGGRVEEVDVPEYDQEEGGKSDTKDEGDVNNKKLTSDDFPGIQFYDEKGNRLSTNDKDFADSAALQGLNLTEKQQSIYNDADFHSLHGESVMDASSTVGEDRVFSDPIEHSDPALDADNSYQPKQTEGDNYDGSDLPCVTWWKKQAASLYAQAKETNTFWSIFIAAAVMGLVILGQQWQQERWQALHYKWKNDERMGRMLGPLSRLKDVIVGGNRRGASIRASTSTER